jgi:hypothetical protein
MQPIDQSTSFSEMSEAQMSEVPLAAGAARHERVSLLHGSGHLN